MRWVVVLVLIAAALVGFYGFVPYGPERTVFVEIAPGTGTEGIAGALQQAGIVRSAWAFAAVRVVRGLAGGAGSLKAGEYRFDQPATVGDVYERLRRGDVYTVTVLVPEGYDIFDVADAVARAGARSAADAPLPAGSGFGSREGFLKAEIEHAELVRGWSPRAQSVEGFLFPDTYRFSRRATAVQMLGAMVKRFGEKAAALGLRPAAAPGRSTAEIVTLASLVEKEVHVDAERPLVAGVFENRLGLGMPLQTDPAVVYASRLRGTWTGVIHRSELQSDSLYNTYTHMGLPPGPICNPGTAALRAALHPTQTEYLYFVADAHGATRFSATLAGHAANVQAYRESEAMGPAKP